jgi:hypothetical protein
MNPLGVQQMFSSIPPFFVGNDPSEKICMGKHKKDIKIGHNVPSSAACKGRYFHL